MAIACRSTRIRNVDVTTFGATSREQLLVAPIAGPRLVAGVSLGPDEPRRCLSARPDPRKLFWLQCGS